MLAVAGRPPDEAGWAIEMKWDGVRAIVVCDGDECRFYSRNRRDVTGSYPELAAALAAATGGRTLILDGEVIAQDGSGAPSFGLLQRRMHVVSPSRELIAAVPVQLYLFDVLAIDGTPTLALPYLERRQRLADLAMDATLITTPPHWTDVPAGQLLAVAHEHHLEGIVSKQLTSTYQPGRRSPAWIKTPFRRTTEVIVAGWLPGNGTFAATFGSLVLAANDATGRLTYLGNVGTGFTLADRRRLRTRLDELASPASPFDPPPRLARPAHWVTPTLVADVEYREFTGDGLRHPSWRGLRTDKTPADVEVPK
ncbi:non-homologous end-joining DNA ligase [Nocardia sp. NPDC052566]|uniref:non-homologous end-joining DNA ligase n=1 Tax=Nocardia sp. NPDC052566 TaxID=3364330 RepID=UPI0037CBFA0C